MATDGTVRIYYGGSNGPHDGVNQTSQLGLATLKASDRFVGFRPAKAKRATVQLSVLCEAPMLLIGADLVGASASLRAGAPSLVGLGLTDAVTLTAADAKRGPDLVQTFAGGKDFAAHVGSWVSLAIELTGETRAFSVAWAAAVDTESWV